MEVFNFPYHLRATDYPVSGAQLTLGNSYEATIEPSAPDQRTFILTFSTMFYYVKLDEDGEEVIDLEREPETNMAVLEKFYQDHRLWKSFEYPHPVYGTVVVKFAQPLKVPQGLAGGGGSVSGFEIQLREQP